MAKVIEKRAAQTSPPAVFLPRLGSTPPPQ